MSFLHEQHTDETLNDKKQCMSFNPTIF